ncbi:MAG: hypothetical protein C0466_02735 [Candidatus Accumulibacter sp.]|nr:hypothetical protein [Accumulibacter sp.]
MLKHLIEQRSEKLPQPSVAFLAGALFFLLLFSWKSHSLFIFNGLATPLFIALLLVSLLLAARYELAFNRTSLLLYGCWASWILFADALSGDFYPALARDAHWLFLPVFIALLSRLFLEFRPTLNIVLLGASVCIIYLLFRMYLEAENYIHWLRPPVFGHIRHLGLSIGFFSVLLFAAPGNEPRAALFFRVIRIIGLALVFWSGTRASMLAWLCCMAIFIYCDRSAASIRTLLIDTGAALALSMLPAPAGPFGGFFNALHRSSGAGSADALSSLRLSLWQTTLSELATQGRLLIGVGGNGFARLQVMYGAQIVPPGHVQPHNFLVQAIADWGLIGLTLFLAFVYRGSLGPIIEKGSRNHPAALAGLVYLIITGMLDASLFHLEHLIYLAIVLALLLPPSPPEKSTIVVKRRLLPMLIAASALLHTLTADYRIGLFWYFPTQ